MDIGLLGLLPIMMLIVVAFCLVSSIWWILEVLVDVGGSESSRIAITCGDPESGVHGCALISADRQAQ